MAENKNTFLKIALVISIAIIMLLLLINGVAGYLLYKENTEKEAVKKQLQQQMDSAKRTN